MKKLSILAAGGAVTSVLSLAGCFGGDDVDGSPTAPAVTTGVPASAQAMVPDFIAYLKQLVVASADTLEPFSTDMVTPPKSDTTEPDPLT